MLPKDFCLQIRAEAILVTLETHSYINTNRHTFYQPIYWLSTLMVVVISGMGLVLRKRDS